MNWEHGFSASYYAMVVDPLTWRDKERFEITGGKITRSNSDLMESADIDCVRYPRNVERWVRIYLDALQDGEAVHLPLFTGLATSPDRDINGLMETNGVQCYSVLKPAQDILLKRGWYAPVGVKGAEVVKRLLSVIPAPVVVEDGSQELKEAIVAEEGESNLSMAAKILEAIDWRLRIDGDGTVTVCPKAADVSCTIDSVSFDIVEPQLKVTYDWYDCPNVFRAIVDDAVAIVRDENPESMVSIPSRGREIWMEEDDCKLNKAETLAQYAKRRLREEQAVAYTIEYDRRFIPEVRVSDMIRLHYPAQQIDGTFVVVSQSIELGYGARTSEEVQAI